MTLRQMAVRLSRPRRWCLVAAGMLAAAGIAGCSHHSQTTYRPIFGRSATGCTSCGSGTTVTTPGTSGIPTTTIPSTSSPSMDSSVTPSTSIQGGSGSVRSSTDERPPSAQLGQEPEYDELSPAMQRNSAKPPARGSTTTPPNPASPGSGPALVPPNSGQGGPGGAWNTDGNSTRPAGPTAARLQPDQSAGLASRLEPYIVGTSANELFYPNKADRPWRYIVLHHSDSPSGNYDQIDREHRKLLGYDGCGYHFVIGNGNGSADGQIEVAQRWNSQKQGVHCRNARSHDVDEYGIGICLIGNFDEQPPTPRQIAATQALVAYLSRRYRIEASHVATHAHLAATPTVCPGKYFPTAAIATAAILGKRS